MHQNTGFGVWSKVHQRASFQVSYLQQVFLHLCEMIMLPTGSFVPREAKPPLSDVLQKGGNISPIVPRRILKSGHLFLGYLFSFSTGTLHPQDSTLAIMHTSKTLVFEPQLVVKPNKNQPLLFTQTKALGKCFPCVISCALLSLSLSFPLTFFCSQCSLPSITPTICFSPQITSFHLLPSTRWPLLSL